MPKPLSEQQEADLAGMREEWRETARWLMTATDEEFLDSLREWAESFTRSLGAARPPPPAPESP